MKEGWALVLFVSQLAVVYFLTLLSLHIPIQVPLMHLDLLPQKSLLSGSQTLNYAIHPTNDKLSQRYEAIRGHGNYSETYS